MSVSRFSTVLTSSTNGDTFVGPCRIVLAKAKGGSGSATLTAGGVVVYDSGTLASGVSNTGDEIDLQIPGGATVTIGITGTCTIWLYLK